MSGNSPSGGAFAPLDYALFLIVVIAWGLSWYGMVLQGSIAAEPAVFWRFGLAALIMFAIALARGERLSFAPGVQWRFALPGVFLFCTNFILFYHASRITPSGLLSVVFSLSTVINLVLAAIFLKQKPTLRLAIAGAFGFVGVIGMFAPRIFVTAEAGLGWTGLLLCLAATLSFSTGNILSARNFRDGYPIMSCTALGMAWGACWSALATWFRGESFALDFSISFMAGLAYLVLIGSVVGFLAYLRLISRVGPSRAAYATVAAPVVALTLSTALGEYAWTLPAVAGLVAVFVGNLLVLAPRK